jgi:hypothetical protein
VTSAAILATGESAVSDGRRALSAGEGPFTRWSAIFGGLGLIVAIIGVGVAIRSIPRNDAAAHGATPGTTLPSGGGRGSATPSGPKPTTVHTTAEPPYVQTSQFTEFSQSYGEFAYDVSGNRLTITSTGDYWERGGILKGSKRCTVTVDFDLRMDEAVYHTDAYWGFGVVPRGHLQDDQPAGDVLVIEGPGDDGSQAAFSTEPTPGHGGFGFDWHTLADMRQQHHVTVTMTGDTMHAVVAGEHVDDHFGSGSECGSLIFFTWGGATAHISNILIK